MKDKLFYLIVLILISSGAIAQISTNKECTFCKSNELGSTSSAIGVENLSTGDNSLASGQGNSSTGKNSVAFGFKSTAIGNHSLSGGKGSYSSGKYSLSYGLNDTATNEASVAFGYQSVATGIASFATGYASKAFGDYSTAIGVEAHASGYRAVSIGLYSIASDISAFAIGTQIKATNNNSFVIGTGPGLNYLENNIQNSLKIGFGSTKSTLFVSTATGADKTGKIGIGDVTNPQAKLHIKADFSEDVTLLMEPGSPNDVARLYLGNTQHSIVSGSESNMEFRVDSIHNFIFYSGNVGIGTTTPTQKLEVNGNILQTPGYNISSSQIKASDANGLTLTNQNGNGLFVDNAGNVGIGTLSPLSKLEVIGGITATSFIGDGSGLTNIAGDNLGNHLLTQNLITNGHWINGDSDPNQGIFINGGGKVGIGTAAIQSGYLLTIDGKIITEEVKIQNSDQWYDFVFDESYALPALVDIENFVKENKHLPDVPSAEEVAENGYELGEMNGILLKKVEELTLYVIEQQKMMEQQQEQIKRLAAKVESR